MSDNRIIFNSPEAVEPISISASLLEVLKIALAPGNAFYSLGESSPPQNDAYRFSYLTFAPGTSSPIQMGIGVAANYTHFFEMAQVQYLYVVRGELSLDRHDGQEVTLKAGDLFVVNGAMWGWHNRGSIPVTAIALTFEGC